MKLTHICIITGNIEKMKNFYLKLFGVEPEVDLEKYVEFNYGGAKMSLFDEKEHNSLAPNSAVPMANRSVMIEFEVENVEAEYQRMQREEFDIVKGITVQPWGNCSIYIRDCDGNLVNLYSKVKPCEERENVQQL